VLLDLLSVPTRRSSDLEQIAPPREQLFLDDVLGAAGDELAGPLLLVIGQWLAQPAHGAVQMMQLQFADPFEDVVHAPALRGSVTDRKSTRLNSSHGSIS